MTDPPHIFYVLVAAQSRPTSSIVTLRAPSGSGLVGGPPGPLAGARGSPRSLPEGV